jgi:hypothetical protein
MSEDAMQVMTGARKYWEEKVGDPDALKEIANRLGKRGPDFLKDLDEGFPELDEWAAQEHAERMLRAEVGSVAIATERLIKAIECRVRGREIYNSYRCPQVGADMRVIGRDTSRRSVIYWCAGSQTEPLKAITPQILITIEAAIKLSEAEDGKICLIADMHNFSTKGNLDYSAIKEIGDFLGSVYADRMFFIMVVDFSMIVRMGWKLCYPLLNERTLAKISFPLEAEARTVLREKIDKTTYVRLETAFDINRDPTSTTEDRLAHALRTSICDVPLGSLIEKAG